MNYNIKGTEVAITQEIRDYLEKRLGTLDKFLSNKDASRADVEVEFMRDEAKMYRAEFMVHDSSLPKPFRAEAQGATLHEAIDIVAGELFNDMSRTKKKRMHVLRHSATRVKEYVRGFRDRF